MMKSMCYFFYLLTTCFSGFLSQYIEYRPTEWLRGSGETSETLPQLCTTSSKSRLRGAAEPLSAEAGVGRRDHRL